MWKIVIIDDDFQVARGLRKAIPWEELEAEFAGEAIDGESGLKLIEEVNPDIVLTDIYMPVMNGIQMIEELKKNRDFAGRFVILSGYNDFEYARTAIRLGVDDYLTKPVTMEQIRSVLKSAIEKLEEAYLDRLDTGRAGLSSKDNELGKEKALLALLNGWSPPEELPSTFIEPLEACNSMILIMEVLWNGRIRSLSLADWNLFKFAVSNIVTEVLQEQWPKAVFVWLFGNHAAFLLPSHEYEGADETYRRAESLSLLLVDNMRKYLNLETRIGLGQVKSSWKDIKASAEEAMQKLLDNLQSTENEITPETVSSLKAQQLPPVHEKHRKAVQFIIDYIHEHYAEDITLEPLASELYISKNYLNQLFKKVTGETFTNYVIRVRIEKAKALLKDGSYLIYEVSELVGYQNVPYFSTLFKKYCGVNPSELMKQ